jgi:hypothetical protein
MAMRIEYLFLLQLLAGLVITTPPFLQAQTNTTAQMKVTTKETG